MNEEKLIQHIVEILRADGSSMTSEQLSKRLSAATKAVVTGGDTRRALFQAKAAGLVVNSSNQEWELGATSKRSVNVVENSCRAKAPSDEIRTSRALTTAMNGGSARKESRVSIVAPSWTELRRQFIQALKCEVEELKRGKAGSSVVLVNGKLIREDFDWCLYRFQLESFFATLDDAPAQLSIGRDSYECQILTGQGGSVDIQLRVNLGPTISAARLQSNSWALLQKLCSKYEELTTDQRSKFACSSNLFAGKDRELSKLPISLSLDELNPEQRAAVEKSLTRQLCVIWGPPGTGKTKTIAAAVKAHVDAGRRVLLVSHANTAVDAAMSKIAKLMEDGAAFKEGRLIRYGNCSRKDEMSGVLMATVQERKAEELVNRKKALSRELSRVCCLREALNRATEIAAAIEKSKSRILDAEIAFAKRRQEYEQFCKSLSGVAHHLEEARSRLSEARSLTGLVGGLKKILLRLDPERISARIAELEKREQELKSRIALIQQRLGQEPLLISGQQTELDSLKCDLAKSLAQCGQEHVRDAEIVRASYGKTIDQLERETSNIDAQLGEVEQHILSNAMLVGTTLTKTFCDQRLADLTFDVLVLDEASMAPLPLVHWAAHLARSSATIVGDFKQLPTIGPQSNDDYSKQWLGASIFQILGITSVDSARRNQCVVLLKTQYRMNPEISAISNALYYDGELKDAPSTTQLKTTDSLGGEESLILVDTSRYGAYCTKLSESRFNLYHAMVTASLAKRLLEDGSLEGIGIVASYRPQVVLIRKILADWKIGPPVRVDTVHRFQGGEEGIVIFDCVESNGVLNRRSVLDADDSDLLLNVAFTRAQKKMFLIADKSFMDKKFAKGSDISRIISHFSKVGTTIDSDRLVQGYGDERFDEWIQKISGQNVKVEEFDANVFATDKEFWPMFLSDLLSAKKRVTIMSPFVANRRFKQLADILSQLRRREVEITLHIRPPAESPDLRTDAEEALLFCQSAGISVVQKAKMHEKIAIIDDRVLWEGSLNILSHNQSSEQMRRMLAEKAVSEVIQRLKLNGSNVKGVVSAKLCKACGSPLVVRERRADGHRFLGCSTYNEAGCRYTEDLELPLLGRRHRKS